MRFKKQASGQLHSKEATLYHLPHQAVQALRASSSIPTPVVVDAATIIVPSSIKQDVCSVQLSLSLVSWARHRIQQQPGHLVEVERRGWAVRGGRKATRWVGWGQAKQVRIGVGSQRSDLSEDMLQRRGSDRQLRHAIMETAIAHIVATPPESDSAATPRQSATW